MSDTPISFEDECERAIIGHAFTDLDVFDAKLSGHYGPEDVAHELRARLLDALVSLATNPNGFEPLKAIEIVAALPKSPSIETIRNEVFECVAKASEFPIDFALGHARLTAEKRAFEKTANELQAYARSGAGKNDALELARSSIERIAERSRPVEITQAHAAISEALEFAHAGKSAKQLVGVAVVDELLGGFPLGSMNTIAARPGGGKTTFGVNIAREFAAQGGKAGIISMEMSRVEIAQIIAAQAAQIDHSRLVSGKLTDDDYRRVYEACNRMVDTNSFVIAAKGRMTLGKLRGIISRMVKLNGCRLIVIDYLQRLTLDMRGRLQRFEEMAEITAELKTVAMENECILITLAQLNREIEKETRPRYPRMSDLGDSSSIEKDSDSVSFLWKWIDDREAPPQSDEYEKTAFVVAKHRHGPTGMCAMYWHKKTRCFWKTK